MTSPGGTVDSSSAERAGEIMIQVRARLMTYLRFHVENPADREDLYQETFVLLQSAIEQDSIQQDERAYTYGILRNLVLKHIRNRRRSRVTPLSEGHLTAVAALEDSPEPDEETRRALSRAVDGLADVDRELIRLVYQERMKAPQIARRMGRSADWVRQRLTRARRKLRKSLAGLGRE